MAKSPQKAPKERPMVNTLKKPPKKEYSTELTKLLDHLKINNPTPLQDRMFKLLNEGERVIYMAARKKKAKADRNRLHRLMKKSTFAK